MIDLHCDLLSFLQFKKDRTPLDPLSRCSCLQLKNGKVECQILAVFSLSRPGSVKKGERQIQHFDDLLIRYSEYFEKSCLDSAPPKDKTSIMLAFENASSFCEELEPLTTGLARLEKIQQEKGQIAYVSLTWNGENRFGGGDGALIGLKEDGKRLLDWMDEKRIPVDLSHASDLLAHEIIEYIDKKKLTLPVLASHSNFRKVHATSRNLPDSIAQEIIRKKGVIGINLFMPFVGMDFSKNLISHIEHGLNLGGENALCFGADFFCDYDFPDLIAKYIPSTPFFPAFADASKYPELLQMLQERLGLSQQLLKKISSENASQFLRNCF